jgi:galactose mutarotase-like enzyme
LNDIPTGNLLDVKSAPFDFTSERVIESGVVVYSGNSLKSEGEFRGTPAKKHLGICLETQALPDAVHHPHFPSTILDINQAYSSVTVYKFGIEKNNR